ncbi:hypothetical protein FRC02_004317 [Tulasnella sp. 418]|nr:hypothetical protein FRC02_004317 [Tulasnella sp. 418]
MSTQQVKELFNGTNYQSWSVDMRAILEANRVWQYVKNPPMAYTAAPAQVAQQQAAQPAAAQPAALPPHQIPGALAVKIIKLNKGLVKNIDKAAGLIKSNMEHSFSLTTDSTKIADSIPHIPVTVCKPFPLAGKQFY